MENIPRIIDPRKIDTVRLPVTIPVHACLQDHHVEGQAVLPAVKAMQVIGETVKLFRPDMGICAMTRARFDKFLHIPSGTDQITAFVDIDTYDNGDIGVRLQTKNQARNSSLTRIKEHASVYYPLDQAGFMDTSSDRAPDPVSDLFSASTGDVIEISPERIYRELVPFGPAFHSIKGDFRISDLGVFARIGTPAAYVNHGLSDCPGLPFPLDAAYHGACVWGQRYARRVAFPIGFEKRIIWHHTQPEETYICRILPIETRPDQLVFDLWIADEKGVFFESSRGVCMKDVSAGRMKPPQWITEIRMPEG